MPRSDRKPVRRRRYKVHISKEYFPRDIWPVGIGVEHLEAWTVLAHSRAEAAHLIWVEHGTRLLSMMEPWTNKLPRHISLHVNDPTQGVGGFAGRLVPIRVL